MKKTLKSLSKSKPKAKAKATPTVKAVAKTEEVTLFTEDLPKGLQIVAGTPVMPGSSEWQRRQNNFNAKKAAKLELATEVKPLAGKIVIDLSKLVA